MKNKYAFLGVGNMASAIIKGLMLDGTDPSDTILFDKEKSKITEFEKEGFQTAESAEEAIKFADFIVLAVQPQNFEQLFESIRGMDTDGKCFVSIAAGISIEKIRTMPNAPLRIGKGVTALTRNSLVSDKSFALICRMFSRIGEILTLTEDKMNAVISATSSAPAYVYLFIKSIMDAAKTEGIELSEAEMKNVICRMVIGSAELMMNSDDSPDALIKRVTTPGGTTEPAVKVLKDRGMPEIIAEAMMACVQRAEELGR